MRHTLCRRTSRVMFQCQTDIASISAAFQPFCAYQYFQAHMKLLFVLAVVLTLGVINGDPHVDDTAEFNSDMKMVDDDHLSEFEDSPNNLGVSELCHRCRFCKDLHYITDFCQDVFRQCGGRDCKCCA